MNPIDSLAWRSVMAWLERYCRRQPGIRRCFVRHSTAFEAQNVFVTDYDLAFFVEAADFGEVRSHAIRIGRDLRKARVLDPIVLPATETAYSLAATHYVHRSIYPLAGWRCVYGEPLVSSEPPCAFPPFDHSPEGFLYGYVVPALVGSRRRHRFERTLVRRKSAREREQLGEPPTSPPATLHDLLPEQVQAWDRFFERVDLLPPGGPVAVRPISSDSYQPFLRAWADAQAVHKTLTALESVWVYPAFNNDHAPHVVVNVDAQASATQCANSLEIVRGAFRSLEFDLLVGTEGSMRGRLGGLSRVSLLEPWLCRAFGHCLHGDSELRQQIREPCFAELQDKLRELYLYFSYRLFPTTLSPYPLYRLCFTLDQLFERSELILAVEELRLIYGSSMLSEAAFADVDAKQHLLAAFRDLHGLDLFEAPG